MPVLFLCHQRASMLLSTRPLPCMAPINDQEVLTRLEGFGKEGDSPLRKAAGTLAFYILQVL